MSLVSSLNIAQQAMSVNQAALTIVSNNIANVDNKSYSKLSADLTDVVNYTKLTGNNVQVANTLSGVQISRIQRYEDEYLESYYRSSNSNYSYSNEYSAVASNVQDIVNELKTTGLSSALSDFYTAASALGGDATDVTLRRNYIAAAQTVCSVFNNSFESLNSIQTSLVGNFEEQDSCDSAQIGVEIDEVNSLLEQIASVNKNIIQTGASGSAAPALLDKRDELLSNLSDYIPINTKIEDNGSVSVSLANYDLVRGSTVAGYLDVKTGESLDSPVHINIVKDPKVDTATNNLYLGVEDTITSGSIGGILTACGPSTGSNLTISGTISELDTLASSFAAELNRIQSGPITDTSGNVSYAMRLNSDYTQLVYSDPDPLANSSLFKSSDTTTTTITAGNISVNSNLVNNLYLIAAGRSSTDANGDHIPDPSSDVGNTANITLINNTRTTPYDALGDQTFEKYISSVSADVGVDVEQIDGDLAIAKTTLSSVQSNLASKTGVSLDEELGDLVKYQQAYQAAARIFSVCSDLLDQLINLGR